MLELMTPPSKTWALLVVLALGFWAGGAAAQSEGGDWFDEAEPSAPADPEQRPTLKIEGKGPYDPPPPDFRSDPPAAASDESETTVDAEDVEDAASQQQAVTEFSPRLAPYGYWVEDSYYGRVWVPHRGVVGPDFRPYVSGGHWALTPEDEWLWVSDYPFGDITFHYGRWAWLSGGSWGWVPGYVYSPAWVDFRIGASGYVGWGPAAPYSVWRGGVFIGLGVYRPAPYIFCPTTYVFSSSLPRYVVYDRHRVRSIAAHTHRYRPRYVAASGYRVRSPSVREARIPSRYVPERRVLAEPRGGRVRGYRSERAGRDAAVRESRRQNVQRRDLGVRHEVGSRYDGGSRRALDTRRSSTPNRLDVSARPRGPAANRLSDIPRSRYQRQPPMAGDRRSVAPRSVEPPRDANRAWRNTAPERRASPPPRGAPGARRDDAPRSRSYSPPAQRRDSGASRGADRRGGDARRSNSGSSRGSSQQRSRDSRGSR